MSAALSGREGLVVAVPVLFLDVQMPELKDTELRVFLAVLRQTDVQGKEIASTWLTHRELCRRTGRASEAVSAAIDALVQRGMLRVFDATGKELTTAGERQARTGQRFYQAVPLQQGEKESGGVTGKSKSKEVNKDTYRFRKTEVSYTNAIAVLSPEERERVEAEKARIREQLRLLHPS